MSKLLDWLKDKFTSNTWNVVLFVMSVAFIYYVQATSEVPEVEQSKVISKLICGGLFASGWAGYNIFLNTARQNNDEIIKGNPIAIALDKLGYGIGFAISVALG